MDAATLRDLEGACELAVMGGGTPAERANAQARVVQLGASTDNIPAIQGILDNSASY